MKKSALFLMCVIALAAAAGCAQKSASEQLRDDMKKAGNQLNKDTKALLN